MTHYDIAVRAAALRESVSEGKDLKEAVMELCGLLEDLHLVEERRKVRARWVESGVDPVSFEYPAHLR